MGGTGIAYCIFLCMIDVFAADYTITPINSSSGLYYEKIGEVSLSNNNWEFITYVNYADYLIFYQYLHQQAETLRQFCDEFKSKMNGSNECDEKYSRLKVKLDDIERTDEDMANYLGIKVNRRVKRGFWSAIGGFFAGIGRTVLGVVGSIFGGNQPDLSAYEAQIRNLQNGQQQLANALKDQWTVFTADSERKNYQIQWLNNTQAEIQTKLLQTENDFKLDAAEKAKQIKDLHSLLNETRVKLQEQEAIQKKLVSDVEEIKNKILSIDKTLEKLNQGVANNTNRIEKLEFTRQLDSVVFDYNFILDQFQTQQKNLFNAVVKAKKGRQGELDVSILSPSSLIKMLQDIIPHLKEDEKFPFHPNVENAYKLYNLIEPNVYLFNNTLIFILKIPLVKYKIFNLYKISSLPVHIGQKTFAFVLPQEPYLLVDNNDMEYMLLPQDEFELHCQSFGNITYLCKQKQYTHLAHTGHDCEMKLFTTIDTIPKSCDKRIMKLEDAIFIQLMKKNSWVYVAANFNTKLSAKCDTNKYFISVEGVGMIDFGDNCIISYNNNELTSLIDYTKPILHHYSSKVNLADFIQMSDIESINFETKKYYSRISPFEFKKLNEISLALDKIGSDNSNFYFLLLIPVIIVTAITVYIHFKMKMDYEQYRQYLSRKFSRNRNSNTNGSDDDRLKVKVKMNNKHEKICNMSVTESPSETDPEAEYLSVTFKVKKEKEEDSSYLVPRELEKPNSITKNYFKNPIPTKRNLDGKTQSVTSNTKNVKKIIKPPIPAPKEISNRSEDEDDLPLYGNCEQNSENKQTGIKEDNIYGNDPQDSAEDDNFYGNVTGDMKQVNPDDNNLNDLRKNKPSVLWQHLYDLRRLKPTK